MLYKQAHVYMMSNTYRTVFYIGVTADLRSRVWQHINGEGSIFVKKYKCHDLIYHEYFERITDAFRPGETIKKMA